MDKIYVLAKIVTKSGELRTFYLGVAEQSERTASNLLEAVKPAINETCENYKWVFLKHRPLLRMEQV